MTITAITGDIGSGKSFKQFQYGLYCCNRYKKRLVTNFGVSVDGIKKYAVAKKYWWVVWLCDNQLISVYDLQNPEDLASILSIPRSVVLLDEAGVFLNTRDFAKTPRSLLTDLAQSRKQGTDLIYAAQFDGQVDKQFRLLTQYFIHAAGTTIYSSQLRNQKLVWKNYSTFTAGKYWEWSQNPKAKNNIFRTFFAAISTEAGPLTRKDSMIFDCFHSFARLDNQKQNAIRAREKYTEAELIRSAIRTGKQSAELRRKSSRELAMIELSALPRFLFVPQIKKAKRYLAQN